MICALCLSLYSRELIIFNGARCSSTPCQCFFNDFVLSGRQDTMTKVFAFCRESREEGTLIHLHGVYVYRGFVNIRSAN